MESTADLGLFLKNQNHIFALNFRDGPCEKREKMEGILLISHGEMAPGMLDSARMFFGDEIPQLEAVSLKMDMTPEAFLQNLKEGMMKVDTGEGVLVFADLLGGTPANLSAQVLSDNVRVVTGLSMTMLLEALAARMAGVVDLSSLMETGKNGIVCLNKLMAQKQKEREERAAKERPGKNSPQQRTESETVLTGESREI